MRPPSFDSEALRRYLLTQKIADLPGMRAALASSLTAIRKLKALQYASSYTHLGMFYSLLEIVRFDDRGLWSFEDVWLSWHGTLVETTIRTGQRRSWRQLPSIDPPATLAVRKEIKKNDSIQ